MARRQAASSRSAPWRSARPMTGSSDQESMHDHAALERRDDTLERRSRVEMSTEQASSELGASPVPGALEAAEQLPLGFSQGHILDPAPGHPLQPRGHGVMRTNVRRTR